MDEIKIDIPENVEEVLQMLEDYDYEAYVVGGCVRDYFLGIVPKDFDICTNATPEQMLEVFKDYSVIETGLKHGTITVMVNNEPIEVTTYRIDGEYTDNRKPDEVIFTNDLERDLARRDLTINAMAYNHTKGLIDPYGGLWDIEHKIIRCVGNPLDRFKEDSLRILRAIRFGMRLRFQIHNETKRGIIGTMELLHNISAERIQSELNQILTYTHIHNIIQLHEYRILDFIIPELKPLFDTTQNNPYHIYNAGMHTLHAVASGCMKLHVKLALLFHDIGKPYCKSTDENGIDHFYRHSIKSHDMCIEIMRRLKYSNEMIDKVSTLVLYHDAQIEPMKKSVKRWMNKIGEKMLFDLLEVRHADIKAQNYDYLDDREVKLFYIEELIIDVLEDNECFKIRDLDITGKDIIDLGYKKGKIIGDILDFLLKCVIEEPELNEKDKLIKIIRNDKKFFKLL